MQPTGKKDRRPLVPLSLLPVLGGCHARSDPASTLPGCSGVGVVHPGDHRGYGSDLEVRSVFVLSVERYMWVKSDFVVKIE